MASEEVQQYINLGLDYFDKGDWAAALDAFDIAREMEPSLKLDILRARLLIWLRECQKAIQLLEWMKIEYGPVAEFSFLLCRSYFNLGNMEAAETYAWEAIDLSPSKEIESYTWHNLGMISIERMESDSALGFFQKAVSANPGFAEAHLFLGLIFERMEEYDEAETHIRRAVDLNPSDSDYKNKLFRFYINRGNTKKAQAIQIEQYPELALVFRYGPWGCPM